LRWRYLRGLKEKEMAEKGFKRWIGRLDEGGEMVNGVRLMVDVWKDRT